MMIALYVKKHDNCWLLKLTVDCFFVQKETDEIKCCLFGHTLIKVETENYEQYLEYIGAGKMTVNFFLLFQPVLFQVNIIVAIQAQFVNFRITNHC